ARQERHHLLPGHRVGGATPLPDRGPHPRLRTIAARVLSQNFILSISWAFGPPRTDEKHCHSEHSWAFGPPRTMNIVAIHGSCSEDSVPAACAGSGVRRTYCHSERTRGIRCLLPPGTAGYGFLTAFGMTIKIGMIIRRCSPPR